MSYIFDPASRKYRSSKTATTTAVTNVKKTTATVYSKPGLQVSAPQKINFSTKISFSPAAQIKLASGVRTNIETVLKAKDTERSGFPEVTIPLERPKTDQNSKPILNTNGEPIILRGLDVLSALSESELQRLNEWSTTNINYGSTVKTIRLPIGSSNKLNLDLAKKLGSNILERIDGSINLELSETDLKAPSNNTVFSSFKTSLSSKITSFKLTNNTSFQASASDIKNLGWTIWNRYEGNLSVSDNTKAMVNTDAWQNMRILNNARNVSFNLKEGIPIDLKNDETLDQFDFKLDYNSLISGYNLLQSINRSPEEVKFTRDQATTQINNFLVSGKILKGDSYDIQINIGNTNILLSTGPLQLNSTATLSDRVETLKNIIKEKMSGIPELADVIISSDRNNITFTTQNTPFSNNIRITQNIRGTNERDSFIHVEDVPVYGLDAIANTSEVGTVSLKTSIENVKANWDKLSDFLGKKSVKKIDLSGEGNIGFTSDEIRKYSKVIELLEGRNFIINDQPFTFSAYTNFSPSLANKLASSLDLTGSTNDLSKASFGLSSLAQAQKISKLTFTDPQSTLLLNASDLIKLSSLIEASNFKGTIAINGPVSLLEAAQLADKNIKSRIAQPFTVDVFASEINANNLNATMGIASKISSFRISDNLTFEKAMLLSDRSIKIEPLIRINDTLTNIANKLKQTTYDQTDLSVVYVINGQGSVSIGDAMVLNSSIFAPKIVSGLSILDSSQNITGAIQNIKTLVSSGRLREIRFSDTMTDSTRQLLTQNDLLKFVRT